MAAVIRYGLSTLQNLSKQIAKILFRIHVDSVDFNFHQIQLHGVSIAQDNILANLFYRHINGIRLKSLVIKWSWATVFFLDQLEIMVGGVTLVASTPFSSKRTTRSRVAYVLQSLDNKTRQLSSSDKCVISLCRSAFTVVSNVCTRLLSFFAPSTLVFDFQDIFLLVEDDMGDPSQLSFDCSQIRVSLYHHRGAMRLVSLRVATSFFGHDAGSFELWSRTSENSHSQIFVCHVERIRKILHARAAMQISQTDVEIRQSELLQYLVDIPAISVVLTRQLVQTLYRIFVQITNIHNKRNSTACPCQVEVNVERLSFEFISERDPMIWSTCNLGLSSLHRESTIQMDLKIASSIFFSEDHVIFRFGTSKGLAYNSFGSGKPLHVRFLEFPEKDLSEATANIPFVELTLISLNETVEDLKALQSFLTCVASKSDSAKKQDDLQATRFVSIKSHGGAMTCNCRISDEFQSIAILRWKAIDAAYRRERGSHEGHLRLKNFEFACNDTTVIGRFSVATSLTSNQVVSQVDPILIKASSDLLESLSCVVWTATAAWSALFCASVLRAEPGGLVMFQDSMEDLSDETPYSMDEPILFFDSVEPWRAVENEIIELVLKSDISPKLVGAKPDTSSVFSAGSFVHTLRCERIILHRPRVMVLEISDVFAGPFRGSVGSIQSWFSLDFDRRTCDSEQSESTFPPGFALKSSGPTPALSLSCQQSVLSIDMKTVAMELRWLRQAILEVQTWQSVMFPESLRKLRRQSLVAIPISEIHCSINQIGVNLSVDSPKNGSGGETFGGKFTICRFVVSHAQCLLAELLVTTASFTEASLKICPQEDRPFLTLETCGKTAAASIFVKHSTSHNERIVTVVENSISLGKIVLQSTFSQMADIGLACVAWAEAIRSSFPPPLDGLQSLTSPTRYKTILLARPASIMQVKGLEVCLHGEVNWEELALVKIISVNLTISNNLLMLRGLITIEGFHACFLPSAGKSVGSLELQNALYTFSTVDEFLSQEAESSSPDATHESRVCRVFDFTADRIFLFLWPSLFGPILAKVSREFSDVRESLRSLMPKQLLGHGATLPTSMRMNIRDCSFQVVPDFPFAQTGSSLKIELAPEVLITKGGCETKLEISSRFFLASKICESQQSIVVLKVDETKVPFVFSKDVSTKKFSAKLVIPNSRILLMPEVCAELFEVFAQLSAALHNGLQAYWCSFYSSGIGQNSGDAMEALLCDTKIQVANIACLFVSRLPSETEATDSSYVFAKNISLNAQMAWSGTARNYLSHLATIEGPYISDVGSPNEFIVSAFHFMESSVFSILPEFDIQGEIGSLRMLLGGVHLPVESNSMCCVSERSIRALHSREFQRNNGDFLLLRKKREFEFEQTINELVDVTLRDIMVRPVRLEFSITAGTETFHATSRRVSSLNANCEVSPVLIAVTHEDLRVCHTLIHEGHQTWKRVYFDQSGPNILSRESRSDNICLEEMQMVRSTWEAISCPQSPPSWDLLVRCKSLSLTCFSTSTLDQLACFSFSLGLEAQNRYSSFLRVFASVSDVTLSFFSRPDDTALAVNSPVSEAAPREYESLHRHLDSVTVEVPDKGKYQCIRPLNSFDAEWQVTISRSGHVYAGGKLDSIVLNVNPEVSKLWSEFTCPCSHDVEPVVSRRCEDGTLVLFPARELVALDRNPLQGWWVKNCTDAILVLEDESSNGSLAWNNLGSGELAYFDKPMTIRAFQIARGAGLRLSIREGQLEPGNGLIAASEICEPVGTAMCIFSALEAVNELPLAVSIIFFKDDQLEVGRADLESGACRSVFEEQITSLSVCTHQTTSHELTFSDSFLLADLVKGACITSVPHNNTVGGDSPFFYVSMKQSSGQRKLFISPCVLLTNYLPCQAKFTLDNDFSSCVLNLKAGVSDWAKTIAPCKGFHMSVTVGARTTPDLLVSPLATFETPSEECSGVVLLKRTETIVADDQSFIVHGEFCAFSVRICVFASYWIANLTALQLWYSPLKSNTPMELQPLGITDLTTVEPKSDSSVLYLSQEHDDFCLARSLQCAGENSFTLPRVQDNKYCEETITLAPDEDILLRVEMIPIPNIEHLFTKILTFRPFIVFVNELPFPIIIKDIGQQSNINLRISARSFEYGTSKLTLSNGLKICRDTATENEATVECVNLEALRMYQCYWSSPLKFLEDAHNLFHVYLFCQFVRHRSHRAARLGGLAGASHSLLYNQLRKVPGVYENRISCVRVESSSNNGTTTVTFSPSQIQGIPSETKEIWAPLPKLKHDPVGTRMTEPKLCTEEPPNFIIVNNLAISFNVSFEKHLHLLELPAVSSMSLMLPQRPADCEPNKLRFLSNFTILTMCGGDTPTDVIRPVSSPFDNPGVCLICWSQKRRSVNTFEVNLLDRQSFVSSNLFNVSINCLCQCKHNSSLRTHVNCCDGITATVVVKLERVWLHDKLTVTLSGQLYRRSAPWLTSLLVQSEEVPQFHEQLPTRAMSVCTAITNASRSPFVGRYGGPLTHQPLCFRDPAVESRELLRRSFIQESKSRRSSKWRSVLSAIVVSAKVCIVLSGFDVNVDVGSSTTGAKSPTRIALSIGCVTLEGQEHTCGSAEVRLNSLACSIVLSDNTKVVLLSQLQQPNQKSASRLLTLGWQWHAVSWDMLKSSTFLDAVCIDQFNGSPCRPTLATMAVEPLAMFLDLDVLTVAVQHFKEKYLNSEFSQQPQFEVKFSPLFIADGNPSLLANSLGRVSIDAISANVTIKWKVVSFEEVSVRCPKFVFESQGMSISALSKALQCHYEKSVRRHWLNFVIALGGWPVSGIRPILQLIAKLVTHSIDD